MAVRVAHTSGGRVTNVTLRKSADDLPPGLIALGAEQRVGPGWGFDGEQFIEPTPTPEPEPSPFDAIAESLHALAQRWEAAGKRDDAEDIERVAQAAERAAEQQRGQR